MVEVMLGRKPVDLPYTIRLPGVTEKTFEELTDEDTKAELLDGVMIVHSPATLRHDHILTFVGGLMAFYADERELGKMSAGGNAIIHLATCRKFAPDGYFLRTARIPKRITKEYEGAPDLMLEILSPTTRDYDLEEKRPAYQKAGVGEIWFVDPENEQVIIDRKRRRGYVEEIVTAGRATSIVLGGFWVDVAWLWLYPLPNRMACLRKILAGDA
jgi:Uma2 family endonuclease